MKFVDVDSKLSWKIFEKPDLDVSQRQYELCQGRAELT